jgi:hypothetical protein
MPPQQPDRLLDLIDDGLDFSAHGEAPPAAGRRIRGIGDKADLTVRSFDFNGASDQ